MAKKFKIKKIERGYEGSFFDSCLNDTVYFETNFLTFKDLEGTTIQIQTSDSLGYRETLLGNTHTEFGRGKRPQPLTVLDLIKDLLNIF